MIICCLLCWQHTLWANRIDLSLSAGSAIKFKEDALKQVHEWESYIVVDNCEEVWFLLRKMEKPLIGWYVYKLLPVRQLLHFHSKNA